MFLFYFLEDPPENHLQVIGGLLLKYYFYYYYFYYQILVVFKNSTFNLLNAVKPYAFPYVRYLFIDSCRYKQLSLVVLLNVN